MSTTEVRPRDLPTVAPEPLVETKPAELDEVGWVLMRAREIACESWAGDGRCVLVCINDAGQELEPNEPRGEGVAARAWDAAFRSVGFEDSEDLWEWNDTVGRTKEEVALALERAAIERSV